MLAVASGNALPMGMSKGFFILFSLIGLSLLYRMWFNSISGDFDYLFVKEIQRENKKMKENASSSSSDEEWVGN